MAAEVALAMVVLVAAGLFFQSFRETRDDPGFRREGVLLAAYDFTGRNLDGPASGEFRRPAADRASPRARHRIGRHRHADSARHSRPAAAARSSSRVARARTARPTASLSNVVTPGYFADDGYSVCLPGDDFAEFTDMSTPPQAIVNEEFVHSLHRQRANDRPGRGHRLAQLLRSPASSATRFTNRSESRPRRLSTSRIAIARRLQGEIHVRTRVGDATVLAPRVRARRARPRSVAAGLQRADA